MLKGEYCFARHFLGNYGPGVSALGGLKHETFSEIFPMLFQAEFYISRFFTKKCMHSPNGQTDFDKWYLVRNRMTRATRYWRKTWDQLSSLTLKRSNVGSSAMSSELWPQISRKGYKIERWSQLRANIKLHVVYRNTLSILTYSVSERSKVVTLNLRSWITQKRCQIESSCQQTTNRKWYVADRMAWVIWPLVTLEGQNKVICWKTWFLCEIAL